MNTGVVWLRNTLRLNDNRVLIESLKSTACDKILPLYLINEDLIKLNEKKQYVLTSMNFRKILPYQTEIFKYKAKFIRKVLNLLVIS